MVRTESTRVAPARRMLERARIGGSLQPHPTDPPQSGAPVETPASLRGKSLFGLRILVVEDDADARELVTAVLAEAGAVVESAGSVAEGFDAVSRFNPELLVSDIAMPEEDGYSLMRRVRALDAAAGGAIPAIAVSAFTRPEDRGEALAAGFSLHIGKPVLPVDLVRAVRELIAAERGVGSAGG